MLPDLDVLAFRFNVSYANTFGHRGASHSLMFAMSVALVACMFARRLNANRCNTFLFVGISVASHGILDMFTNGGKGVALWWPFSTERLFAPWQVIEVSPLNLHRVFSGRGMVVFQSELLWVWLPAIVVCSILMFVRRNLPVQPSDL
jgi:inner membrane protein